MVSPSAIPVPPVTVDRYGNMTSIERAAVPSSEFTEFFRFDLLTSNPTNSLQAPYLDEFLHCFPPVSVLYPEFISRKIRNDPEDQFPRRLGSPPPDSDQFTIPPGDNCPACSRTSEDYGVFLLLNAQE